MTTTNTFEATTNRRARETMTGYAAICPALAHMAAEVVGDKEKT